MKTLTILLFLIAGLLAQEPYFITTTDVGNRAKGIGYSASSSDSVFFNSDTMWIAGDDSIEVYLPIKNTLGMIRIKGTVTGTTWLKTARHGVASERGGYDGNGSLVVKHAVHSGNAAGANSDITSTYTSLGTVTLTSSASDSTEGFSYWPLKDVTDLKDQASAYWSIRFVGAASKLQGVWLQLEYIPAN